MNEYLHVFQNYIYIYYLHTGNDFFQVDPLWANISEKICRQCARILLQAPGSDLGIAVNIKFSKPYLPIMCMRCHPEKNHNQNQINI
jgi:hypothetical protein